MRKLIVVVLVCAACTRGHRDRTGFDALSTVPVANPQPLRSPLLRADVKQHLDERLGIPTFLQAVPRQAGPNLVAAEAAREHLATFAPLYGMTSDQAISADLRALHDTGRGAIIARFGQSIAGVDVFRDELRVVMDRQKRVIALSGYLAREAAGATAGAFKRGERDAVGSALAELGAATPVGDLGPREGGYFAYGLDGGSARAKRVFFHLPGNLEPAHYVEVSLLGTKPTYQSFVFSAGDGRLLFQNDLVFYDQFTYRVWADTTKLPFPGPQGRGGSPHPTGLLDAFQAPFIAPVDVTLANFPFSKNDPWLPAGSAASVSTQTVGNNADAYVDLRAPDGLSTGDFRATVTAPGVFGHTYDTTVSPDASNEQRMAAIQQLFYDVNFFHDWYYDAGFDEASGNAQDDNLGRGRLGGGGGPPQKLNRGPGGPGGGSAPCRSAGLQRPGQFQHGDARRRRPAAHADVHLQRESGRGRADPDASGHRGQPRGGAGAVRTPGLHDAGDARRRRSRLRPLQSSRRHREHRAHRPRHLPVRCESGGSAG